MACSRAAVAASVLLFLSGCARPDLPPASHAAPARPGEPAAEASPEKGAAATDGDTAPRAPAGEDERALEARHHDKRALAVLRGEATYYGDSFRGRRTASGEPFDPALFTAAHRTLPFGSVVRVVCPKSRHAVYVRINDRGPFGSRRRIIDLSRAAAERLDILRTGVAEVRLEVVELGRRGTTRKGRR